MLKCTDKYFAQSTPGCFFKSKNKKQTVKQAQAQDEDIQLIQVIEKLQLVLFSLKEQSQKVIKFSKQEILINQDKIKKLQKELQKALNKNKQLECSMINQSQNMQQSSHFQVQESLQKILKKHKNKMDQQLQNDILRLKNLIFCNINSSQEIRKTDIQFNQKNKQFSNLSTNIDSNKRSNIQENSSIIFINKKENTKICDQQKEQSWEINASQTLNTQSQVIKQQTQKKQISQCVNQESKPSLLLLKVKQNQDQWLCLQSKNSNFGTQEKDNFSTIQFSQISKLKEPVYLRKNQNKNKENQSDQYSQIHKISAEIKLCKSKLHYLFSPLPAQLINKKIQIPKNVKKNYLSRDSGVQNWKIFQINYHKQQDDNFLNRSFGKKSVKMENIMRQKIMNKQTQ